MFASPDSHDAACHTAAVAEKDGVVVEIATVFLFDQSCFGWVRAHNPTMMQPFDDFSRTYIEKVDEQFH